MESQQKKHFKSLTKVLKILKIAMALGIFLAMFFGSAGTFNWPEAWIFICCYITLVTGVGLWLKKYNPELLKERVQGGRKKNVKDWDQKIMLVYTVLLMAMFILTGLDAVRFHWSKVPVLLKVLGFVLFIPPVILLISTMVHNSYLSERVRIQEDRGHKVCTTGPYQWVRHPMYVGIILALLCFPLVLGSLYAYIPAVLIVLLFLLRTALEDKTLTKELSGYQEYAEKVRYRLIPGLW